jgi:hypothetical protein
MSWTLMRSMLAPLASVTRLPRSIMLWQRADQFRRLVPSYKRRLRYLRGGEAVHGATVLTRLS